MLLNYGIDECRFTKPVYPGMTIGVRLTVKEKVAQKKDENDVPKGIVNGSSMCMTKPGRPWRW